jgi:succinate dehydrogenase/fumarate reductase flavoprotein subunit
VVFANNRVPGEGAYDKMNRARAHILAPASGDTSYAAGMASGASGLVKKLKEHLDNYITEKKAYLAMETTVTELILEDGKVVGVKARNTDGSIASYRASSIILATGGYGHSEALLKEYNFKNVSTQVPSSATGSGYTMAKAAGADFRGMDFCSSYAGNIPINGFYPVTLAADTGGQTGLMKEQIWVGKDGKRLADETSAHTKQKSDIWNKAEDNIVYIILSSAETFKSKSPLSRQTSVEVGWTRLEELVTEEEHAFKGDTIDALAEAAGINKTQFASTINTYNNDVDIGKDSQFGRETFLAAFDQGPYYAIRTIPFIMMTSGGVKASPQAEMLKADGTPIPGAYLAGEIIGLGNVAGKNTIAGMGNGNAAVWGFIAAESAVKNSLGE